MAAHTMWERVLEKVAHSPRERPIGAQPNPSPSAVANRIVTVGDPTRLRVLASMFDKGGADAFAHVSKRGFTTVTGTFEGVRVSVIAIGMGFPMIDMMVREVRATTTGPLLIARFGSCGGIGLTAEVGKVVVATGGAVMVQRNWDFFMGLSNKEDEDDHERERKAWETDGPKPYNISGVCPADAELSGWLRTRLEHHLTPLGVATGVNVTADSFYSSQGRTDPSFRDLNSTLVSRIPALVPGAEILEMETFTLLHCAACAATKGKASYGFRQEDGGNKSIRAAACAMVFADRKGNTFIAPEEVVRLEKEAGRAVLEAVTRCPLDGTGEAI
ncbi:hypothetical protein HK104_009493 [Borealophlyctis nickersoniae]|nr:hypothetical protein HK104_009493 [Borealophlyctis nickersoniae]